MGEPFALNDLRMLMTLSCTDAGMNWSFAAAHATCMPTSTGENMRFSGDSWGR